VPFVTKPISKKGETALWFLIKLRHFFRRGQLSRGSPPKKKLFGAQLAENVEEKNQKSF
jgi:hypothetical protein